jgi:Uma2 family endonuclease
MRLVGEHVLRAKAGRLLCAPMDVVLSESDVVQPDLLFIAASRASIITEKNISGAPDLVVEIISEASRKTDETVKRKLYERCGAREYWIVDPELEKVAVYRLAQGRYSRDCELSREAGDALQTPLLPGFKAALVDIFA